ncbi:hypothetical protein C8R43DRAFT_832158, partial [Mycena crocata]
KKDAPRHRPTRNCRCDTCDSTRTSTGCKDPHRCFCKARELLNALHDKWNPMKPQPEDYEERYAPVPRADPNEVEFDPRITTHGTIADTFRIFTRGSPRN